MSDNKIAPSTFELLSQSMNDVAPQIGEMDPYDPVRGERLKELCALSQISKSRKSEHNKMICQKMDELAREILTVPQGHPRRARIVSEVLRLSEMLSK
jgi:hypothetical protein